MAEFGYGKENIDRENGVIAIIWCVDDVDEVIRENNLHFEPELTFNEKMLVLLKAKHWYDANIGICWGTLDYWLRKLYGDRIVKETKAV